MKLPYIFGLLLVGTLNGHTQTLKPGLWQVDSKRTSESGRIEKFMASFLKSIEKLPESKRKAYEAKLAQYGAQLNGTRLSVKACITPAMDSEGVEPLPIEGGMNQNGCTIANVSREATIIRSSFFCADDSHGERLIELDRENKFIVQDISTVFTTITFEGRQEHVTVVWSNKFISAACGNIKPFNN